MLNVEVQCIGVQRHAQNVQKVMVACGSSIHLSLNVKCMS